MRFRTALLALWLGSSLAGQQAAIRVVLAADAAASGPPALVWLRRELLPQQSGWQPGTDPLQRLLLVADAGGVRCAPTALRPRGYLDGEFVLPGTGSVLLSCDAEGLEDWFAPADAVLPPRVQALLQRLGDAEAPLPRSVDPALFCGSASSGLGDGDPRQLLLTLGMRRCGQLTWQCWRDAAGWRVRGRSGGGLLLPALGAALASVASAAELPTGWQDADIGGAEPLAVRAFAGRDGDRDEAARQLARQRTPAAQATLRALLFDDGTARRSAMDSLLRHGDPAQLLRLCVAADPTDPLSVDLARAAIASFWPRLPAAAQAELRQQLRQRAPAMLGELPAAVPAEAAFAADRRGAAVAALAVLLLALFGFWLRERLRPAA